MSWQHGSERPDPRASDVDADHRPATEPRRLHSGPHRSRTRLPRRRIIGAKLSLGGAILARRAAIASVSAALLLASVFLPPVEDSPSYARDLTFDDIQTSASPPPEALSGSSLHLPSLVKREATPNLDPLPSQGQGSQATAPQPTPEPARTALSSRGGSRPTPDISTQDKFIAAVAEAARESQLDSLVPASVTIAQAILESDWGRSLLARKGQNYFGIKAGRAGPGPAGVIKMNTWEVLSGTNVVVNDGFKAYHNLYESVMDHGRFLADNPRYSAAFQVVDNPQEFARRIHAAGYATDPSYSTKLINLMNKFNLYQYDLKP